MKTDRLTRLNEQMRREIGTALFRLLGSSHVDLSTITVTHVFTSSDLRSARVLVSIRDNESKRASILALLNRHHADVQAHLAHHMVLKYTPRLKFFLDESIEQGDRVLAILDHLSPSDSQPDLPADTAPPPPGEKSDDEE